MDKKAIETLAVNAVRDSIVVCNLLDQFIPDNDKEPSWDGHIYIYEDKSKTKDRLKGRLPVQVKGTENSNFSKDEISFSASTSDLRNYLNDGGAIFFVVHIGTGGLTNQIYYSGLTPIKLRILLNDAKGQKNKSIKLKRFPTEPNKKEMICLNCWEDCQRQASFANATLYSVEELEQLGILESLSLSVTSVGGMNPQTALLTNEVYLYANIKGGVIPQPIEAIPQRLVIQEERDAHIMVGDRLFYTKVKVTQDGKTVNTLLGSSFSISIQPGKRGMKYNYKGSTKIRQLAVDLDFMLSLIAAGSFTFDGVAFPFDSQNADLSNFPIDDMKKRLDFLKRVVQLLDQFSCQKDIDLTTLQEKDWRNLDYLIRGLIDNEPVAGLKKNLPPVLSISVGDLKFIISLFQEGDTAGVYRISDFFTTEMLCVYDNLQGERLATSQYFNLRADDFLTADNVRYDVLLPSFQKTERNQETMTRANYLLLELLIAYDMRPDPKMLDTAKSFSEWIMTASEDEISYPIRLLNDLQIRKRQRKLTAEEEKELYRLIESPDSEEATLVGAYLLLDQQTAADLHFEKLPVEAQEEFKKYPIYHFWCNGGNSNGQA